jgi:PAS domain S-box-containing protein
MWGVMDRVLACLIQDHDALIIGLAALVCAAGCAAFVALATQSKAYASPAGRRLRNLVDALVLAHTVWTTHFVAMVGYRPAVSGSYEIGQTIASYLLVFVASVIAILLFEKATLKNRVAAGVAFCVGLAGMHYVGMASVTFPLLVEWDPGMVSASLVLGLAAGVPAFVVMSPQCTLARTIAAGVLLVVAISGLHFTGMASVTLVTNPDASHITPSDRDLMILCLIGTTLIVMTVGLTVQMKRGPQHIWRRNVLVVILLCICGSAAFVRQYQTRAQTDAYHAFSSLISDTQAVRAELDQVSYASQYREMVEQDSTRTDALQTRLMQNARQMSDLAVGGVLAPQVRDKYLADTAGSDDSMTLHADLLHYVALYGQNRTIANRANVDAQLRYTGLNARFKRLADEVRYQIAGVNARFETEQMLIFAGFLLISAYQGLAIAWPGHRSIRKAISELELQKRYAEKLALVAERTADAVFMTTPAGIITWANNAFASMTGLDGDCLAGQSIAEFVDPDHDGAAAYRDALARFRDAQSVALELAVIGGEGQAIWLSLAITPVVDDTGLTGQIIHTARDITAKKRLQSELAAHRDHLAALVDERTQVIQTQARELEIALAAERELNALQTQFVAMASHEFRTPLAIIDGIAHRVERRADQLAPSELRERVSGIRSSVKRMTMLIERMLDASRLSSGRMQLKPDEFDPCRLVSEVCARQREVAPGHAIAIDLTGYPEQLFGDVRLLESVFANLLSNAVKYSPASSTAHVHGWVENGMARLSVRDHGVGIPVAEQSRLFEKFFRASTSAGISGTGIGLNLVKSVVEMHGGLVSLTSAAGEGTEIIVSLPIDSPLRNAATLEEASGDGDAAGIVHLPTETALAS